MERRFPPVIDDKLPPPSLARLLEYYVRGIEDRRRGKSNALTRRESDESQAFYRAELLRSEFHNRLLRCLGEDDATYDNLLSRSVSAGAYLRSEPDHTGVDSDQEGSADAVESIAQRLEWALFLLYNAEQNGQTKKRRAGFRASVRLVREDLDRVECEERFGGDRDAWAFGSTFADLRVRVRDALGEGPVKEFPAGARFSQGEKRRFGDHVNGSCRIVRGGRRR
ncbi:hypothetical protein COU80_05095 [Candidatus Peregrinibacteria bacterium CG10_big_fil_rev_8_21_14_0_10_55_24]|nr:MAG: hypothetical protein COU80_05095 [Candidatus Peregrinibacteria bacterium CG10_big_fil_rev_8_21_14_0_10_55_24]